MSLQSRLPSLWQQRCWQTILLWPLSRLFSLLRWGRRYWQTSQQQPHPGGVKVVVIGNITVGGSGKTPLLIALTEALQQRGIRVGVVSRGYGGASTNYPCRVTADSAVTTVGDEPLLIVQRTGVPLVVDPNRVAAIAALVAWQPVAVILSDDGLQHYRMARDREIIVVDGQRLFGNRWLLPAGPLREPLSRLQQANWIVINGGDEIPPLLQPLKPIRMQLCGANAIHLQSGEQRPLSFFAAAAQPLHALAGIGDPSRFFNHLQIAGLAVISHSFADHHPYKAEDLNFFNQRDEFILMTEKDAVKWRPLLKGLPAPTAAALWYLPVTAILPATFINAFINQLELPPMDSKLLEILACPLCKGPLQYHKETAELVCRADRLAFPIRDDIPVMLEEEARPLTDDELN
ncbi:MAG: tetraacyldisaccharide 4'-kinase [Gammaproteobacteria bacterium]|nr:tetraacyldisaccharide 4'-kinase [Gammaproteobacteria bacterium]